MSRRINKAELISKIRELAELTNDEKSALLGLLNEKKVYGLVWENHEETVEEQLREQLPVFREVPERRILSDDADAPNHIIIEAENLHALVALTYTHAGKIDVMYLDPPYNTGNKDFVYNDSYVDSEDSYRHSKWLSFMEKRLKIAKTLLSDKGVIFISIDDNEQANLKLLCDEVLGQENFVALIPWRKRTAKSDVPHGLSQDYEWILCYAKTDFLAGVEKETRKYYETPDFPNKPWRVHDLTKQTSAEERPNSFFTIINPKTKEEYPANPNRTWAITQETFLEYYNANRIVFPGDYDFLRISKPALRYWKADDEKKAGELFGFTSVSTNLPSEVGMTQDGTKDIDAVFGSKVFGFPKPLSLIKYLLQVATPRAKNVIVLDFFAGSGTTFHATMKLNAEDGGCRQCILVTNNENGICENVTYERNKRVIQGYTTPKGEQVEGLTKNNLRYYKADFISREPSSKNKRELVKAATDLLCIKENLYEEVKMTCNGKTLRKDYARRFADGEKEMIIIYEPAVIKYIVEELKTWAQKEFIKIYVFSEGRYAYDDDFKDVIGKITLCALPDAIYQAYRRVLPRRKKAQQLDAMVDDEEMKEALADAESYSYQEEKGGEV
jgi:adenine-specific DNA-methyltransferase